MKIWLDDLRVVPDGYETAKSVNIKTIPINPVIRILFRAFFSNPILSIALIPRFPKASPSSTSHMPPPQELRS